MDRHKRSQCCHGEEMDPARSFVSQQKFAQQWELHIDFQSTSPEATSSTLLSITSK